MINFTYYPCSIINISLNTHEIREYSRGEIGRHKGPKKICYKKLI